MTGAVATTIAIGVATSVAGAVISKALAPKPKAAAAAPAPVLAPPPAPEVAAPTLAPVADDQVLQAAKRKSLLSQTARGGRASTILSDASDKLGA